MRVGLVGCGSIGKVHAKAIAGTSMAQLCAFADIRADRAKSYSQQYTAGTAAIYDSLEQMLTEADLDLVHICTPHDCHVPMAIAALKRNVHVFAEKPPAIDREGFALLEAAAAASKARIGICFQNRYNLTTQKVSELLDGGSLGKVCGGRAFVTWNRNAGYYTGSDWRGHLKREGGGALMNQSIHTLDLLLMWMGQPVVVEASIRNHHLKNIIEVEDTLEVYLAFENSADPVRASFYATNAYVADEPVWLELLCEHGAVRLEGEVVRYYGRDQQQPVYWQSGQSMIPGKTYWGNGHEACICDFYYCAKMGLPYRNDLASVGNTFDTVMKIYESARDAAVKQRR